MPQMSPLLWMFLYLYIIMLFIFMNILIHSMMVNQNLFLILKIKSNLIKKNLVWLW